MPRCAVCRLLRGNEGEAETSNEGKKNSPLRPYTLSFFCSRLSLSPSRFLPGVFYYIVVARARLPPSSVVTFRRYRLRYRVSVPVKSKTLERVIFRPHSKSLIFRFSLSRRLSFLSFGVSTAQTVDHALDHHFREDARISQLFHILPRSYPVKHFATLFA